MNIRRRRIRSLRRYLGPVARGDRIVVGLTNLSEHHNTLQRTGLTYPPRIGETVLPAPAFGPISQYNAEGKYKIHKNQPKETAYRTIEWRWKEWRGRYDTEEMSKFVDVPYKRFKRTFISPPSVELSIASTTSERFLLISHAIEYQRENDELLLHTINLFLEIFRECTIFWENLSEIIEVPIVRLNWQVLPPGRRPWSQLRRDVDPIINAAPEGNQVVIRSRLETINQYQPDFVAVGRAGFRGYVIFGFQDRNLYVLESVYFGNATYVFEENWELLSQMTKAEILDRSLQRDRIIHRTTWYGKVQELLED